MSHDRPDPLVTVTDILISSRIHDLRDDADQAAAAYRALLKVVRSPLPVLPQDDPKTRDAMLVFYAAMMHAAANLLADKAGEPD